MKGLAAVLLLCCLGLATAQQWNNNKSPSRLAIQERVWSENGAPPGPGIWSKTPTSQAFYVFPSRDSRAQTTRLLAQPVGFLRDDGEGDVEDEDESQEDEQQNDSQSFTMPSWSELFPTKPRPGERVQEAQFQSDAPTLAYTEQRIPSGTPLLVGKFDPKGKFRSFPPGQVGRYRVIKKNVNDDESQEDESQEDEEDQADDLKLDWNEWFPQVPIPKGGQGQGGQGQGQGGQLVGGRFRTGMVGGGGMKNRRVMYTGRRPMQGRPYYIINGAYNPMYTGRRVSGVNSGSRRRVSYPYNSRPMSMPMSSTMSMRNPYYYVTRPRVRV